MNYQQAKEKIEALIDRLIIAQIDFYNTAEVLDYLVNKNYGIDAIDQIIKAFDHCQELRGKFLATYNALVSYYIENTQRTWDQD